MLQAPAIPILATYLRILMLIVIKEGLRIDSLTNYLILQKRGNGYFLKI